MWLRKCSYSLVDAVQYDFFFFYSGHLNFGVFSPEQMRKLAHLHVVSQSLYSQDLARKPIVHGVLDRRMVLVVDVIQNVTMIELHADIRHNFASPHLFLFCYW